MDLQLFIRVRNVKLYSTKQAATLLILVGSVGLPYADVGGTGHRTQDCFVTIKLKINIDVRYCL